MDSLANLSDTQDKYFFRLPHGQIIADYIWPGIIMSSQRIVAIREMKFGPNDVVIVTYPKSGTTWMSELLSALVYEGDTTILRKYRQDVRVPWLELDRDHWWVRLFMKKDRFFGLENLEDEKQPLRRVYFTHLPLELLPKSVLNGNCRVIYVARNPKDNAVSFFHHHRMARFLGVQKNITWEDFFALYITGSVYCGSWFEHVLGFWRFAKIERSRILFIKFEDLKRNLRDEIDHILQFLGVRLSEQQIIRVIDHCSFKSMKENKMANRQISVLFDQKVSKFMRKGEIGDWKNYFTLAQSELFDRLYEEKMQDSELEFQFE